MWIISIIILLLYKIDDTLELSIASIIPNLLRIGDKPEAKANNNYTNKIPLITPITKPSTWLPSRSNGKLPIISNAILIKNKTS